MRARVAPSRGGNISSRTKTREKECAIRFASGSIGSSHCARTEFSSLSDRPHLHISMHARYPRKDRCNRSNYLERPSPVIFVTLDPLTMNTWTRRCHYENLHASPATLVIVQRENSRWFGEIVVYSFLEA